MKIIKIFLIILGCWCAIIVNVAFAAEDKNSTTTSRRFGAIECVKDPSKVKSEYQDEDDKATVDDFEDLNGDGITERLWTARSFCGSGGCTYDVYLSSADCFVKSGRVEDHPEKLSSKHNGVYDLRSYHRYGCGNGIVKFHEFDGQGYVENEARQIECGDADSDDSENQSDSPLCASFSCTEYKKDDKGK